MKIVFHWNRVKFYESEKPDYEEKFRTDFNTLFKNDPKEAHVYFESYDPGSLSGIITNESEEKLCSFVCDLLAQNRTTYNF